MIERFTRHPTASNLLMLLCLSASLYMMPQLQRETLPDFAASEIEIRIPFPGATAEEVEEVVSQRVEDAFDRVTFIKELRAEAR